MWSVFKGGSGDVLGQVLVADPKYVDASLAVMRAELDPVTLWYLTSDR